MSKLTENALMPCPFCGGIDIRIHKHGPLLKGDGPESYAQCYGCTAIGPNGDTPDEAGATASWNRRRVCSQ